MGGLILTNSIQRQSWMLWLIDVIKIANNVIQKGMQDNEILEKIKGEKK